MTASKKSFTGSVLELVAVVLVAVGLALGIQAFVVKPYRIPSGSMIPTLAVGQRILVDRIGDHFSSPGIGGIFVFHPPRDYSGCADPQQGESVAGTRHAHACDTAQSGPSSQTFVKRVVGLPGDRLRISDGNVIRNGRAERDGFTTKCGHRDPSCEFPGTIVVPRGDYYMMGDNRPDSEDSRFWGPVPKAWIIGEAFFTYWPPGRVGTL